MLKIGLSACIFHPDPVRPVFKGKALLYLEKSMADWVHSQGALGFMIPTVEASSKVRLKDLIQEMDGLILQGGADVAPETYGESPMKPEWAGDAVRDAYEIELFKEAMAAGKPVLGICRGIQLINVALGGTLYQDIATQEPKALCHRNWEIYDQNFHTISFSPSSGMQRLFPDAKTAKVNSVHHQALKGLGKDLVVEARCEADGLVEAVRLDSELYVAGVQWHPEFQRSDDPTLLDSSAIMKDFLDAVRKRKKK